MTKALIFDLDSCLAAATEVGEELYAPAFDAMRSENHGLLSEETLGKAFVDCWRHPLDWVAAKYGFSEAMLAAGWKVFVSMETKAAMHGYGDLAALSGLPAQLFLVTSGFRKLQASKIRALGLDRLFAATHIDAIDEPDRMGKQKLFELILDEHNFKPADVLVVGDNSESEIEAGNRLGMRTVQILRPGVPRGDNATFHIHSLDELKQLLMPPR